MNFVLIDYKGGATFAPLAPLPHVVGVVTDLEGDSSLAERAFAALDAEIIRRKRALDAAGVPNLIAYEQLDRRLDHLTTSQKRIARANVLRADDE